MRFLFTITFLLILKFSFSYPTRHWTLKEMTEMSKAVVMASVDSIGFSFVGDSIPSKNIKLTFDEYIFGNTIFGPKFIKKFKGVRCPKTINLEIGNSIILFVHSYEMDSLGNINIQFIGLKKIEHEDQKSCFQNAVLQLKKIHKISYKRKQVRKTTEWLMDCIQNPYLKLDASIDLARNLNYLEGYSDGFCYHNEPFDKKKYYRHLKIKHHKLLRSLIVDSDSFTQADLQIARILGKRNKRKTRKLLIDNLDKADKYLTEDVMAIILDLGRAPELELAYAEYRKFLNSWDNSDNPNRDSILIQKRERFVKKAK